MSDYEPKVGDRVSFRVGEGHHRRTEWGEVVRVTRATAIVKSLGDEHVFRRSKWGWNITKETDAERARREWRASVPRGQYVSAAYGFGGGKFEYVSIERVTNAKVARAVSRELEAISAWLDNRPEGA